MARFKEQPALLKMDCYMEKNCIGPAPAWGNKCRQCFLLLFLLIASFIQLPAQTGMRITGHVRDSKGAPISGVSVTVKGRATGTTTDNTGSFAVNVSSGRSVLVFSNVGYLPREVTVGSQQNIEVTL